MTIVRQHLSDLGLVSVGFSKSSWTELYKWQHGYYKFAITFPNMTHDR